VGLTLQPNIGFAFSPIAEGCLVNVWDFLFSHDKQRAIFKNSFDLAYKLVHEYAHYEFWRDHNMLGKDKKAKEQFSSDHGLEDEKYALTEEAKFLEKMQVLVPEKINIKLFCVKSWTDAGIPDCEIEFSEGYAKVVIEARMSIVNGAIKEYVSKKQYDNEMTKQNIAVKIELSSILNLSEPMAPWSIVEISDI
jgi:hypothetical protein